MSQIVPTASDADPESDKKLAANKDDADDADNDEDVTHGHPEQYSPALAVSCSILSDIAYEPDEAKALERLKKEVDGKGELVWRFNKDKFIVAGYMFRTHRFFFVVYRGTADAADAQTDVTMALVPTIDGALPYLSEPDCKGILTDDELQIALKAAAPEQRRKLGCCARTGKFFAACGGFSNEDEVWIHQGFARAISSTQFSVEKQVKALNTKNLPIIITGHSLGGASAVLSAYVAKFPVAAVYTYGQPRVGGPSFRDAYEDSGLDDKTFRHVHSTDLIPRSPPLINFYRHAGHNVFMDSSGKSFWNMPLLYRIPSDLAGSVGGCLKGGMLSVADDHHAANYVEDCKKILANKSQTKIYNKYGPDDAEERGESAKN